MSHQTYRTYRPQTFDDVVEQQHIVTTLKNAVMSEGCSCIPFVVLAVQEKQQWRKYSPAQ